MRKKIFMTLALASVLALPVFAHDLFLKLDSYFLPPNSKVTIKILNGSFQASEGAVNFARLNDVSVVAPAGDVTHPQETDFTKDETTSFMNLQTGAAGTYVVGLSTMPREIDLKAKDFNDYLTEDGLPDTLAERKRDGELEKDARERYAKHVKAIYQVGDTRTDSYKKILGYPVEIVPQQNPYNLKVGKTLKILCLKDGKPLAGQVILAGREDGTELNIEPETRTDKKGIAKIRLDGRGKWYVKFINMTKLSDPKLNYESKWATLTFEIK